MPNVSMIFVHVLEWCERALTDSQTTLNAASGSLEGAILVSGTLFVLSTYFEQDFCFTVKHI